MELARGLVAGKIRNQRTMLQRNHVEPPAGAIAFLKCMIDDAECAASQAELLGLEGNAARVYFEHLPGMIKVDARRRPPMRPPAGRIAARLNLRSASISETAGRRAIR